MDCAFDSIILSSRVKYLQYLFHEIVETKMARLNCIIILISIASCVLAEELYSDQYDHIDVNSILSNDKLRNQYINCYMETEPCLTADAKFFKGMSLFIYKIFSCVSSPYNKFFGQFVETIFL